MLTKVPATPPESWITLQDEQQFADRPEIALLESRLGDKYQGWSGFQGNLTIAVASGALLDALKTLRDHAGYDHFSFMTCSHWPETPDEGFHLVYQLYNRATAAWVRIKCFVADTPHATIASACAVYPAAEWHEDEVWDLFGITFAHHPNPRRLLTPDMYDGFPLRRDFPLEGEPLREFQDKLINQWNASDSRDYQGKTGDPWMDRLST
ncbi:MAG: NADH-quinone oxidoreductase subunit C [bacterium]